MHPFEHATIGNILLSNRFVRSATCEGLATSNGFCSPIMTKFMEQLARGGVGLIITGHTAISPEGRAGIRQLCLWNAGHVPALADMTARVHAAESKIICQIGHGGIFSDTAITCEASLGPVTRTKSDGTICREMTRFHIQKLVDAFAASAILARQAGFDGVQIHAAHGYLLSSFLSPYYNQRHDEYGGSTKNRARFLLEVITAVFQSVGRDYPLLVKLNANDFLPSGLSVTDMLKTSMLLEQAGVSAVELSGGTIESGKFAPARPGKVSPDAEGCYKEDAIYYKENLHLSLILVGGFRSFMACETFLKEGICDFIAMSRPFIREPGIINRWKGGDVEPSSCKSDNDCFKPIRAGKGLYCLIKVKEMTKKRAKGRGERPR